MRRLAPVGAKEGADRVKILLRASAEDREAPLLRARLAARDRSVDPADAAPGRLGGELALHARARRRVVDEDRALAHARERAGVAENNASEIIVVADAGEDDVRA